MRKHSVLLKEELCEGCTNCVKKCPTRAIRVHQGKATIKEELCIDCAECIRTCAYHAKFSRADKLADVREASYPIILIPPSFYGQFEGVDPISIRNALFKLGFKDVCDVSLAAEALTRKALQFLDKSPGMYISSSCPAVVRLIKILYPELIGHILPFRSPVEMMAEKARKDAVIKGISPDDIEVFFLTPCPAKYTTIFNPIGIEKSFLDKALSVDIVYQALLKVMEKNDDVKGKQEVDQEKKEVGKQEAKLDQEVPFLGISWGQVGGETQLLRDNLQKKTLSISGIHSVKAVLEEVSRNNIKGIKYLELVACSEGCVGGVFNVMNPYQAKYNLRKLVDEHSRMVEQDLSEYSYELSRELKAVQLGSLDSNMERAMEKLVLLEKEINTLPGLDCAACGAPDCKTLAEDIISGKASESDCVFVLRQQVGDLADRMSELAHALPPVMRERGKVNRAEVKGRIKVEGRINEAKRKNPK